VIWTSGPALRSAARPCRRGSGCPTLVGLVPVQEFFEIPDELVNICEGIDGLLGVGAFVKTPGSIPSGANVRIRVEWGNHLGTNQGASPCIGRGLAATGCLVNLWLFGHPSGFDRTRNASVHGSHQPVEWERRLGPRLTAFA